MATSSSLTATEWDDSPPGDMVECKFLLVDRSLENWGSRRPVPPPKLAAPMRATYKFTLDNLLHWRRVSKTVMFNKSVWLKALLLSSITGILAYVSTDGMYRGEEQMHRLLTAINQLSTSLLFLTMLLMVIYVKSTVGKWHRIMGSLLGVLGRLADLSCLIGNDLKRDPDKRVAHTFYRFLNLAHLFTYKGLTTQFHFTFDELEQAQLVNGTVERQALEKAGGNPRDVVYAW